MHQASPLLPHAHGAEYTAVAGILSPSSASGQSQTTASRGHISFIVTSLLMNVAELAQEEGLRECSFPGWGGELWVCPLEEHLWRSHLPKAPPAMQCVEGCFQTPEPTPLSTDSHTCTWHTCQGSWTKCLALFLAGVTHNFGGAFSSVTSLF